MLRAEAAARLTARPCRRRDHRLSVEHGDGRSHRGDPRLARSVGCATTRTGGDQNDRARPPVHSLGRAGEIAGRVVSMSGVQGSNKGESMSAPMRRNGLATVGGLSTAVRENPARGHALSSGPSFWAAAAIACLAFAANAAASPLYAVYQAEFGFSATTLTLLFTIYIVVLLVTLLFLGSLSDHLGRRPVILAGLAAGAVSCALFLLAQGAGPLFAARAMQGLAVGLISGAASAALLDLRPASTATPLVSSAALSGGQALGALGASALAQYAPAPTRFVWWLLLSAFIVGTLAVVAMPEPGMRRP